MADLPRMYKLTNKRKIPHTHAPEVYAHESPRSPVYHGMLLEMETAKNRTV